MKTRAALFTLLPGVWLAGCGGHGTQIVDEARVAQLPPASREQVIAAHRGVDIANTNVESARLGLDQSKQFRDVALLDLKSADSRATAADRELDLQSRSLNRKAVRPAQNAVNVSQKQMTAAHAKVDYANKLVQVRQARLDQAFAELKLAQLNYEQNKVHALQENRIPATVDAQKVVADRGTAEENAARSRQRVAVLEGELHTLHGIWQDRQHQFNVAARDLETIAAPPAPEPLTIPEHLQTPPEVETRPIAPAPNR